MPGSKARPKPEDPDSPDLLGMDVWILLRLVDKARRPLRLTAAQLADISGNDRGVVEKRLSALAKHGLVEPAYRLTPAGESTTKALLGDGGIKDAAGPPGPLPPAPPGLTAEDA